MAMAQTAAAELSKYSKDWYVTDPRPRTLGGVAIRVDALTLAVSVHDHWGHLFLQDRQHLSQKTLGGETVGDHW